jgi:hypothetical protein
MPFARIRRSRLNREPSPPGHEPVERLASHDSTRRRRPPWLRHPVSRVARGRDVAGLSQFLQEAMDRLDGHIRKRGAQCFDADAAGRLPDDFQDAQAERLSSGHVTLAE